jgi:hypothetical protein
LVIVPLSFVGSYLTSEADTSLKQTIGAQFRSIVQTEGLAISEFINGSSSRCCGPREQPKCGRRDYRSAAVPQGSRRRGDHRKSWEDRKHMDDTAGQSLDQPGNCRRQRQRHCGTNGKRSRESSRFSLPMSGATVAATDKPLHRRPNQGQLPSNRHACARSRHSPLRWCGQCTGGIEVQAAEEPPTSGAAAA